MGLDIAPLSLPPPSNEHAEAGSRLTRNTANPTTGEAGLALAVVLALIREATEVICHICRAPPSGWAIGVVAALAPGWRRAMGVADLPHFKFCMQNKPGSAKQHGGAEEEREGDESPRVHSLIFTHCFGHALP